jgi:hypothetical protein
MTPLPTAVSSLAAMLLAKGLIHNGIGHRKEGPIVVLIRRTADKYQVPGDWEGWPVDCIYSGKKR